MTLFEDRSCGCGALPHPPPPRLAAGLARLNERQWAGFRDYRAAMLTAIGERPGLAGWRAGGDADLGVMLLECWAYVLDVTGFYDARTAERGYIGTAPDPIAAQRIAALLGHRPRGALAARVKLALDAEGADPVVVPRGTAFRSGAFGDEAPQIFELDATATIWPQRNRWRLAPVRRPEFDGILRFLPRGAPPAGSVILVTADGGRAAAARVLEAASETASDGARYDRLALDPPAAMDGLKGRPLAALQVMILRLPLAVLPDAELAPARQASRPAARVGLVGAIGLDARVAATLEPRVAAQTALPGVGTAGLGTAVIVDVVSAPHHRPRDETSVLLDAVYPQVRRDEWAVLQVDDRLHAVKLRAATTQDILVGSVPDARRPVTFATFTPFIALAGGQSVTLHAGPYRVGAPTRPAETQVALARIAADGALAAPVEPLGGAPASGEAILAGAGARGALVSGTLVAREDGSARFQAALGSNPAGTALTAPIDLFGNVVEAISGETVVDEILGSAESAIPFNSFRLSKQPLVWREDASQPDGRSPDLAVRVGGIEWIRVDTFFGRRPDEQIYIVRLEPDGGARLTFGDGRRGARPPSGIDNVRADYRHGAGAATPPPGSIAQVQGAVKGLAGVRGPLDAVGGADAEDLDSLRVTAPAGALTIGRAVSLADFEALARGFGAVNAAAGWTWEEGSQRAAVKLWIISGGASLSERLAPWLAGQATPGLTIIVGEARPARARRLSVELEVEPRHARDTVRAAARAALFDPASGMLAPARQPIGAPLFRSALVHRLHAVPGVREVRALRIDGAPMPHAIGPGAGRWFDLEREAVVR
jgi:predicted phage baseplate assembly protein